jgi:hypothetical protein
MPNATAGMEVLGTYLHDGTDIDVLLALIPDPDVAPAQAGGVNSASGSASFLDEMSPVAAAQLRNELAAMQVDGADFRIGTYTMVAADDTANLTTIVTGLANLTLANCIVQIMRAGVDVRADAILSEPVAGSLRIANGAATYVVTAGDIVSYYVE